MKKAIALICVASAMAVGISGCKTSEENYQQAYEIALAKKTEGLSEEEIAGILREESMPKTVYRGDSIPYKVMYTKWVEGGIDNSALRFSVIVASFKQQFNARSVYERLVAGGYPDAVVLADASDRYYIGAVTTNSLDSAVAVLNALPGSSPVALSAPYPYILDKPR